MFIGLFNDLILPSIILFYSLQSYNLKNILHFFQNRSRTFPVTESPVPGSSSTEVSIVTEQSHLKTFTNTRHNYNSVSPTEGTVVVHRNPGVTGSTEKLVETAHI